MPAVLLWDPTVLLPMLLAHLYLDYVVTANNRGMQVLATSPYSG
jgi:hypothetical protein